MSEFSNFDETEPRHISESLPDVVRELQRRQKKAELAEEEADTDTSVSVWAAYSDEQLAEMLTSHEVPGAVKDEIAAFALDRERQRNVLPPEEE